MMVRNKLESLKDALIYKVKTNQSDPSITDIPIHVLHTLASILLIKPEHNKKVVDRI